VGTPIGNLGDLSPRAGAGSVAMAGRLRWAAMSKRTHKARLRAKRKKANHGQKPNRGR
jgi:hypothetical protein